MIWHRDGKPFNAAQLRKEALPALLPRDLTEKHFLDAGAKRLVEQERPVYNPETHNGYSVIEDVNGIPTKRWIVEPRPKEEVETKRAAEKRNAELREDAEAIRSDEGVVSLLTGRPDDIERYIEERVTADAEVKKVLVALAKATSLLMQGQLRRQNMALLQKEPYNVAKAGTTKAKAKDARAYTAKASKADVTTREVGGNELSATHLEKMLKSESPLMKLSATQGRQEAAKRGLLSSSLAAESAQAAMIKNAQPFALNDANTYANTASENMAATNTGALQDAQLETQISDSNAGRRTDVSIGNANRSTDVSMFNAGQSNETERFNTGQTNTARQLGYTTENQNTQNELDRTLQRDLQTERIDADERLQGNQFDFQRGENQLDRALEKTLQGQQLTFEEAQSALDRALQERLQSSDQSWRTGENELDRALQKVMQGDALSFEETQAALNRALEERLQGSQQEFEAGENAANRALDKYMQGQQLSQQEALAVMDIEARKALQSSDQSWQSSENLADRALQKYIQGEQMTFEETQAALDRALQTTLQDDQQSFASDQAQMDRDQQASLQQSEQAWRSGEAALDRQQQEWLQENEQEFAAAQADMDRELDKYGIDKQRDNVLYGTIMDGMVTILSDPSIKKENKQAAINNLLTQARSAHDFAAQLADGMPSGGSGDSVAGGSGESGVTPDTPVGAPYLNQLESELAGLYQQMEGTFPGQRGLMGRTALRAQIREKERQLEDYRASLA